nr:hypothetical protein [uncultured Kingella sp.]
MFTLFGFRMQTQLAGIAACQECRKARRSRMVLDKRQYLPNHHAAEKRKPGSLKKCKQRDLFQHLMFYISSPKGSLAPLSKSLIWQQRGMPQRNAQG